MQFVAGIYGTGYMCKEQRLAVSNPGGGVPVSDWPRAALKMRKMKPYEAY